MPVILYSQQGKLKTFDDVRIHYNVVERGHKTWLVMTHGVGEHSARYQDLVSLLSKWFNIFTYDLRGHGKTSGPKAYVKHFFDYSKDLMFALHHLKNQYRMERFSLFGHSMGALITADFIQSYDTLFDDQFPRPEKIFLSSPAVAPGSRAGQLLRKLPINLSRVLIPPSLPIYISGFVKISDLSHDPRIYEMYINDPLVHKKLHLNLLLQIVSRGADVFSSSLNPPCPLYCIVGSKDRLVHPKKIEEFFSQIAANDCKEFLLVDGGFHELHNEVERYRNIYENFLISSLVEDNKI